MVICMLLSLAPVYAYADPTNENTPMIAPNDTESDKPIEPEEPVELSRSMLMTQLNLISDPIEIRTINDLPS